LKIRVSWQWVTFKENSHEVYEEMMGRLGFLLIILISMILVSLTLGFNVQAQETKRLGLNTTLRTFGEDIKYVEELGVGTIRVPLQWQLIRIRPGEFDWSTTDRLLKATQMRQIDVLFTLRSIYSGSTKKHLSEKRGYVSSSGPVDIKQWVHFVETLATRYRGQGVHYEIENEVNGEAFWTGTLEEYLELLKVSYNVIKRADPQAKVLPSAMGCGILRNFQMDFARQEMWKRHDHWLQSILSTRTFDVVSIHDYYFPSDIVANGLTFHSYLEHIRDLMKKSGLGDRPVWITETGYVSSPADASGRMDNGSPEKQAKWLVEAYQQAFEFGVERIYWLLPRDRNEPYFGSMGLADAKGNPRLAWNALQQFIKAKGGR
jgi:hypothetical protein